MIDILVIDFFIGIIYIQMNTELAKLIKGGVTILPACSKETSRRMVTESRDTVRSMALDVGYRFIAVRKYNLLKGPQHIKSCEIYHPSIHQPSIK